MKKVFALFLSITLILVTVPAFAATGLNMGDFIVDGNVNADNCYFDSQSDELVICGSDPVTVKNVSLTQDFIPEHESEYNCNEHSIF